MQEGLFSAKFLYPLMQHGGLQSFLCGLEPFKSLSGHLCPSVAPSVQP